MRREKTPDPLDGDQVFLNEVARFWQAALAEDRFDSPVTRILQGRHAGSSRCLITAYLDHGQFPANPLQKKQKNPKVVPRSY